MFMILNAKTGPMILTDNEAIASGISAEFAKIGVNQKTKTLIICTKCRTMETARAIEKGINESTNVNCFAYSDDQDGFFYINFRDDEVAENISHGVLVKAG